MFSDDNQESDGRSAPLLLLMMFGMTIATGGCGSSRSPHPVDPDLARNTLQEVLLSWKSGDSLEQWQQSSSEIVVQDLDWLSGARLEEFEMLDEGTSVDANLYCRVRLKLSRKSEELSEQTVTYLVTTSPKRTVFRQIIP